MGWHLFCSKRPSGRRASGRMIDWRLGAVLLLLLVGGGMALAPAIPAAHTTGATRLAPARIVITYPQRAIYRAGQTLVIRYACTSSAGIRRCGAMMTRPGAKARAYGSGAHVRLTTTGTYLLQVTAVDGRGRSTAKTLSFVTERAISWSGYTWYVRAPGRGAPQANVWSDSRANVRLSGGDLVLSVVRDASGRSTSAEIDNQRHLGYGTYRWVVTSGLSALDPYQVLGMFIYGSGAAGPDEIDLEASRWGNPLWPSGSAAVWQGLGQVRQEATFSYSAQPPYINQLTWMPGRVNCVVTDGTGAVLVHWSATSGVPGPSAEIPIINFWRFHAVAPSVTTTVRISSFSWLPPAR